MFSFLVVYNRQYRIRFTRKWSCSEAFNLNELAKNLENCTFDKYWFVTKSCFNLHFCIGYTQEKNRFAAKLFLDYFLALLNGYYGEISELHFLFNHEHILMLLDFTIVDGTFIESDLTSIIPTLALLGKGY